MGNYLRNSRHLKQDDACVTYLKLRKQEQYNLSFNLVSHTGTTAENKVLSECISILIKLKIILLSSFAEIYKSFGSIIASILFLYFPGYFHGSTWKNWKKLEYINN